MWKTGRCLPFFVICKKNKKTKKKQTKNNSGAKYIMLGKLVAPVELSFVDTYTLFWGQEQLCYDINRNFFSAVQKLYLHVT